MGEAEKGGIRMTGYFIYGDIDTRNYEGIVVSEDEVDSAPERAYEEITIAGRNGTLLLDGNRFENVIHSYDIVVYDDYVDNLIQLRNDILSKIGYQSLRDSFNPDEKYLARVYTQVTPKQKRQRDAGSMHIEFSRKPQRFLTSGEATQTITSGSNITNPTLFASRPLIIANGSGNVSIGSQIITISGITGDIYIDCDSMEIYTVAGGIISGASSHVSFNSNDFPTIPSGTTRITFTTNSLRIVPRWWRI